MAQLFFGNLVNSRYIIGTTQANSTANKNFVGLGNSDGTAANGNLSLNPVVSPVSNMYIYGGTVPSLPTASTTESPLLVFPMAAATNGWINNGIMDPSTGTARNEFIIGGCTTPTAALTSGTATWFAICSRYLFNGTFSDRGTMFGTIGLPGSNADLILDDTALVAGQTYTSSGMRINWPMLWSVT